MTTTTDFLPLTQTLEATGSDEVAGIIAEACAADVPVYPLGGATSLDYGLPTTREGWGLSLTPMRKVVDYPARDLTVTVEAGVTMTQLAELLAQQGQQLPVDVPDPDRATIGGVVASGFNGPRRYGLGTIRDHVIGIQAVDGRGKPFKGGGRVVKNVAGYDFCKLLTGSLGTLGVITQLTLKLRPLAEKSAFACLTVADDQQLDGVLAELVQSQVTPSCIELLSGPAWKDEPLLPTAPPHSTRLLVGLEGTAAEVDWSIAQLRGEWRQQAAGEADVVQGDAAEQLLRQLAQFPAEPAALVLKASVLPSWTLRMLAAAREVAGDVSLLAHAGNGIVLMRYNELPAEGLGRTVVGKLQSTAARGQGNLTILSNPGRAEMTHQSVWGGTDAPFDLMTEVKRQFDPSNLLNPGRFVYL